MKSLKIFSLISLLVLINACQNGNTSKSETIKNVSGEISVDDFEKNLNANSNAQLIDVRTPEEFTSGHLTNAININWNGSDFDAQVKNLDKNKPTFVYCLAGSRSHEAALQLKTLGFNNICEMQGGMRAWKKAGKPIGNDSKKTENKALTVDEYTQKITSNKLILVDFNAPWCGPCRRLAPILEEISKEQKDDLELIKINSDDNSELANALKIENLPTLVLYKNGKEVWKHVGFLDKIGVMVAIADAKKQ